MLCRLTSSKKRPWPWTRRLSSLRGTFWPAQPRFVSPSSTTIGSAGATVVSVMPPAVGEPLVPPRAPSFRARAWSRCRRSRQVAALSQRRLSFVSLAPGKARLRRRPATHERSRFHLLARGRLDRLEDVPVARAAADVALDRAGDLVVGGARVLPQERGRAHQHPGRAVAALERVVVGEGLLELRQLVLFGQALDGLDRGAVGLHREQHAALHERPVEDDAARAAVAGIAADVRAGQVEVVADQVDEQAPGLDLALVGGAVDLDRDRPRRLDGRRRSRASLHYPLALSEACWTARAATTSARCRR